MRLVAVLLCCLGLSLEVSAQDAPATEPSHFASSLARIYPDAYEVQSKRDRGVAESLSQQLEALPSVHKAHVSFERLHPAEVPLDRPLPPAQLRITLQTTAEGPQAAALHTILESVREQANGATLSLVTTKISQAHEAQAPADDDEKNVLLRTLLALSLAANVLLATVLLLRPRTPGR